jgi:hypothetical protein
MLEEARQISGGPGLIDVSGHQVDAAAAPRLLIGQFFPQEAALVLIDAAANDAPLL